MFGSDDEATGAYITSNAATKRHDSSVIAANVAKHESNNFNLDQPHGASLSGSGISHSAHNDFLPPVQQNHWVEFKADDTENVGIKREVATSSSGIAGSESLPVEDEQPAIITATEQIHIRLDKPPTKDDIKRQNAAFIQSQTDLQIRSKPSQIYSTIEAPRSEAHVAVEVSTLPHDIAKRTSDHSDKKSTVASDEVDLGGSGAHWSGTTAALPESGITRPKNRKIPENPVSKLLSENGYVLTLLRPSNETCAWISPPEYRPERVPEKVAEYLKFPLEDYVLALCMLVNDWRFKLHVTMYRRLMTLWLIACFISLMIILFCGMRGLLLFIFGLAWLLVSSIGILVCLGVKRKMQVGLQNAVGLVNKTLLPRRMLFGVDDPGQLTCHKTNIVVVHYNVDECIRSLAQRLEELHAKQRGKTRTTIVDETSAEHSNNGTNQFVQQAQKLILKSSQSYVKDMVRRRLSFRQENRAAPDVDVEWAVPNAVAPKHAPHCLCSCQYVEREQFQPLRSWMNFAPASEAPRSTNFTRSIS